MFLVVDCETNGLPDDFEAPYTDLENWPRAVQIAWAAFDKTHAQTAAASHVIRPDGFEIAKRSSQIHGITTERAMAEGQPLAEVLRELWQASSTAKVVVAHNASFDGNVLAAEYLRVGWQPPFLPQSMVCTMKQSTDYCRLPGPYGNKWPTLEELYRFLHGTGFSGGHDASVDVAACAYCFFELKNRGVIRVRA